MGARHRAKMAPKCVNVFIVMMAAAGMTLAIPSPLADRVPETASLIEDPVATDDYTKAANAIELLQSKGQDDAACRKEADAVIAHIITTTNTTQVLLDQLESGFKCAEEGQAEVRIAQIDYDNAFTRHEKAVSSLEAANSLIVTLSTYSFSFLVNASCGWEKQDAEYLAAEASWVAAVDEEFKSSYSVNETTIALASYIKEAARLKKECECEVQGEHDREWKIATSVHAGDQAAWDQAHNMLCVIDGTFNATHKLTSCVYMGMPKLNKPYIHEDSENQVCQIAATVSGECNLDALVGEEYYALETSKMWKDNYYCYHIKVGSIEQQGHIKQDTTEVSADAAECNEDNFSSDQVVGQSVSKISDFKQLYSQGSTQYCEGKERQGALTIVQDPSATSNIATVEETDSCSYEITITVPRCTWTLTSIETPVID